MDRYRVLIKASAAKELAAVGAKRDRQRIAGRIQALADNPRPPGCRKLAGSEKYRVRCGDYRIVYGVDDAVHVVLIVRIGDRKDVYR